jgi:hypothetical protein
MWMSKARNKMHPKYINPLIPLSKNDIDTKKNTSSIGDILANNFK